MESSDPASPSTKGERGHQPSRTRGASYFLLLFLALVLVLDAVVGERGVIALVRARAEYRDLATALARGRAENARLREEARHLREDTAAIEELARRHLGLIMPGETLFIVKDVRGPKPEPR